MGISKKTIHKSCNRQADISGMSKKSNFGGRVLMLWGWEFELGIGAEPANLEIRLH